jgi:superfamily I DNA/RNA helicase
MAETANLEELLLKTVRSLPQSQQEAVLNFARSLQNSASETVPPLNRSLQELAKLPLAERAKVLSAYLPATAQDFLTDLELTEFSVLDAEDWEETMSAMANDPEIQAELASINAEFVITELDSEIYKNLLP